MPVLQGWRKLPRGVRRVLAIVAISIVSVVVLTNLALWTRLIPWLINAESAALSYDWAWAPWPTSIRVHGLLIAGQDANVRYGIGLERAWLHFDLGPLLRYRTIKLGKVRGSGVSVRILQRLNPWEVDPRKIAALPVVPGLPVPPITDASVPDAPSSWEGYDKISIDVSDVDVMVSELWIDEFRYTGSLHVMGEFLLRPGLELRIGPTAEAAFQGGRLTIASEPLLEEIRGIAQCNAPSFNAAKPPGLMILRYFSGALKLSARIPNAEASNYFVRDSEFQVRGGAGAMDLNMGLARGVLKPGGSLEISNEQVIVRAAKSQFFGSSNVKASTEANGAAALQARITGLTVANEKADQKLTGGEIVGQARSEAPIDLAKALPQLNYSAQLAQLSGPLLILRDYLPPEAPVSIDGGSLSLQGEVSGTTGRPDLKAQARVESEFRAHAAQRRFAGKLKAFGKLTQTAELLELAGSRVELADLMMAQEKEVLYGWWTHVDANGGGYVPGDSPRLWLSLDGLLRDIEPLYVGWGKELGLPGWVQALLPLPKTSWRARLDAESGAFRVSDLRAESGVVRVRLKATKPSDAKPEGAVLVSSGPLSFGVAFGPAQSGSELLATDEWFEKQN